MKKIEFIASVFNFGQLPSLSLPEVVLLGRSNVGKSSFINSLFNRKNLARTGATPGKTRSFNFYNVEDRFILVDLPGFGYAKISKSERDKFKNMITEYITNRTNIQLALHMVDCRHKPTELDMDFNSLLREVDIPYINILSKTDKLSQTDLSKAIKQIKIYFPELIERENLIAFSSFSGRGHKEVLQRLNALF